MTIANKTSRWLLENPWIIIGVVIVVAAAVWATGTRTQPHHVRASFQSAFNLVPGLAVSVDGLEVGKVGKVNYSGGRPTVEIGIHDERFWPLRHGTRVISRWGTTIGSGTRRLDLVPGPQTAPALPEGGIIPTSDTQAAVDIDQIVNTLTTKVRGDIRSMQMRLDAAVSKHEGALNRGLPALAGGLEATGDFMSDLASDTYALRGLVANTHRATQTLVTRADAIEDLVTVAAQTFGTFAQNTDAVRRTLVRLPGALKQSTVTLKRLDTSIVGLRSLVTDLAPGAARLRPLVVSARPAMSQLYRTVPPTLSTVKTAIRATPKLTALVDEAMPMLKRAPSLLGDVAPMVACLRPYAPEAGGAVLSVGSWTSGYQLMDPKAMADGLLDGPTRYKGAKEPNGKVRVHNVRAMAQASTTTLHAWPPLVTTKQFIDITQKQYAFPRPPGLSVGQPWFLPECGVGPDAVDPSKDPESKP